MPAKIVDVTDVKDVQQICNIIENSRYLCGTVAYIVERSNLTETRARALLKKYYKALSRKWGNAVRYEIPADGFLYQKTVPAQSFPVLRKPRLNTHAGTHASHVFEAMEAKED